MEHKPFLKLSLCGLVGAEAETLMQTAAKTAANMEKMGVFDQREHAPAHRFSLGREEGE